MAGTSPDSGDFPIDDGILAKFPPSTTVDSANRYGLSQWTITARLHMEFPDGETNRYLLKTAKGEVGRRLMDGEFYAISALHNIDNLFSPKPHSWARRSGPGPETYFFILQYINMSDRSPDPNQMCRRLHRDSVSPTGKFRFRINTCQGKTQQAVGWEDT